MKNKKKGGKTYAARKYRESQEKYKELMRSDTDTISCEYKRDPLWKIRVYPYERKEIDLSIENKAMKYALEYEQREGRLPKDVSVEGRGCDIISSDPHNPMDRRYIEVKGRSSHTHIRLEESELIQARRLGDNYWLYVYYFVDGGKVEPHLIQNPIIKLDPRIYQAATIDYSKIKNVDK